LKTVFDDKKFSNVSDVGKFFWTTIGRFRQRLSFLKTSKVGSPPFSQTSFAPKCQSAYLILNSLVFSAAVVALGLGLRLLVTPVCQGSGPVNRNQALKW